MWSVIQSRGPYEAVFSSRAWAPARRMAGYLFAVQFHLPNHSWKLRSTSNSGLLELSQRRRGPTDVDGQNEIVIFRGRTRAL